MRHCVSLILALSFLFSCASTNDILSLAEQCSIENYSVREGLTLQNLGWEIRKARITKGLTATILSELCGTSPTSIRQIEEGQLIPSPELQSQIFYYLDMVSSESSK